MFVKTSSDRISVRLFDGAGVLSAKKSARNTEKAAFSDAFEARGVASTPESQKKFEFFEKFLKTSCNFGQGVL